MQKKKSQHTSYKSLLFNIFLLWIFKTLIILSLSSFRDIPLYILFLGKLLKFFINNYLNAMVQIFNIKMTSIIVYRYCN